MNKFLLVIALLITTFGANAQLVYPYQDIKLEKPSDYPETEPLALSAANYLLTTPFVAVDKNRFNALQFLSNWMTGNKDFTFHKNGKIQDITSDKNVLSIFFAAIAKYSLENKTESQNPLLVEQNASRLTLIYCNDPANNFKLRKKYRKLLEKN